MPGWLERRLTGRTPRRAFADRQQRLQRGAHDDERNTDPTEAVAQVTSAVLGMTSTLAYLSGRYWRRRPGRALVSLSGIALGVGLMVAVVSVNQAVLRTYDGLAAATLGRSQVEVRSVESAGMSSYWLERVRAMDGVRHAAAVVEQRSYLFTDTTQASVTLRGVDPVAEAAVRPTELVSGRALAHDDHDAVVLSSAAAASLDVGVGDSVSLLTTDGVITLRVIGVDRTLEASDLSRDRTGVMALSEARDSFMHGRDVVTRIDVVAVDPSVLGGLKHDLEALFGGAATVRLPADELRELATASRGMRFLLLLSGAMALVAAAFLIATNLFAAVEERGRDLDVRRALGVPGAGAAAWLMVESVCFGLVGSVLGAAAGAGLATGLLARLPGSVLGSVASDLLPSVPVGLVICLGIAAGGLVSLVAAVPLAVRARGADDGRAGSGRAPALRHDPGPTSRGRSAALVACLVGVTAAVVVAASSRYAETLAGRLAAYWSGGQGQAVGVGLLVLVLGWAAVRSFPLLLSQLGHGVRHLNSPPLWLRLAADSMRRHSRRSGATAISLMITVAGLVGVYGAADSYRSSLTAWLDATVSWDLKVSSGPLGAGPTVPLPAATTDTIAAVAGVASALPERMLTVSSRGRAVPLIAFDASVDAPSRTLRSESVAQGWRGGVAEALHASDSVALSTALAARLGVSAGQRLPLATPTGEKDFLVVAVVEDPAVDGAGTDAATAYLDIARFAESWNDRSVDEIGVRLEVGVDPGRAAVAVTAAVRSALGYARDARVEPALDPGQGGAAAEPTEGGAVAAEGGGQLVPVQVVQAAAYREEVLEGVRDTFVVIRTLVLVALLVALAGLLNAILIGFWQLRHQLGLLRALGAPIRLLARTLAAEAALTTIAGGGAGVLLGTLLSVALLRGMHSSAGPLLVWSPPVQAYVTVATLLAVAALVASSLLDNRARATPVQAVVAAASSKLKRSIIAAESIVPTGLAIPLPAMSGALPWMGS